MTPAAYCWTCGSDDVLQRSSPAGYTYCIDHHPATRPCLHCGTPHLRNGPYCHTTCRKAYRRRRLDQLGITPRRTR